MASDHGSETEISSAHLAPSSSSDRRSSPPASLCPVRRRHPAGLGGVRLWQLGTPAELHVRRDLLRQGRQGNRRRARRAQGLPSAGRPATRSPGRTPRWASSRSPPASCCSATAPSAGGCRQWSPASCSSAAVYPLATTAGAAAALGAPGAAVRRRRHARHRAVAHRHARRVRGGLDGALHPLRAALRPGRAATRLAPRLRRRGRHGTRDQVVGRPRPAGRGRPDRRLMVARAPRGARAALAGDADRGTRRGAGGPRPALDRRGGGDRPARRRVPRGAAARHLRAQLQRSTSWPVTRWRRLVGAAASDGHLQPAPEGVAHLRVAAPSPGSSTTGPSGTTSTASHGTYRGVDRHRQSVPLVGRHSSRSSRRPSSRSRRKSTLLLPAALVDGAALLPLVRALRGRRFSTT